MKYIEVEGNISKGDAARKMILQSYDPALPQQWVDNFVEVIQKDNAKLIKEDLYGQVISSFVWCYDNSLLGFPRPLTRKALDLLTKFDELENTHYADNITEVLWIKS